MLSVLSCNEYDPVFEESASDRINNLFNECSAALTQSESGWDMLYFINSQSKGYHLIMDFTGPSAVTIAGRNELTGDEYRVSSSSYEFNNSNGPVISFDTYNEVLHPFADPDQLDLGGDFEFVIVSVTDSAIELKGKKNNTPVRMNKIHGNIGHEAYLNEIDEMTLILFSAGSPDYTLEVNGAATEYVFSNGMSSVFSVATDTATVHIPFIVTLDGFRLYEAEEFSGLGARNFGLNSDNSALVSEESPEVRLIGPDDIAGYFSGTSVSWKLDPSSLSPDVLALYNEIISSVSNRYNGSTDIYLALAGIPEENYFSLRLGFIYNRNTVIADVYFDYEADGPAGITFDYTHTGNSAGSALVSSIAGYAELAELISTSFGLETQYPVSVYNLTFTKVSSPGTWFNTLR